MINYFLSLSTQQPEAYLPFFLIPSMMVTRFLGFRAYVTENTAVHGARYLSRGSGGLYRVRQKLLADF